MKMHRISIKPYSVNELINPKKHTRQQYRLYLAKIISMMPRLYVSKTKRVSLFIRFAFATELSDIDNPLKGFIDGLQAKYGFNDKLVYWLTVEKVVVGRGNEYIEFAIKQKLSIKERILKVFYELR